MKFNRILFPVDLSDTSDKIAPYVIMAAEKFKATIHILYVVRELNYYSEMYVPSAAIHNFKLQVIEGAEKVLMSSGNGTSNYSMMFAAQSRQVILPKRYWQPLKVIKPTCFFWGLMGARV